MSILSKLIFVTAFFGVTGWAQANVAESLFQQPRNVSEALDQDRQYSLPLGKVRFDRSIGRDVPARVKRLKGEFNSVLWELSGAESLNEAQARLDSLTQEPQFELLYACKGRDCGESFAWANSVFRQPNLYGNDRNQNLWVVRDKGAQRYHVYYLVERPNRRIYFYEESLSVPDLVLDEARFKEMLGHQGFVIIGEAVIDGGKADIKPLVDKLSPYVGLKGGKQLVVHRHGPALKVDVVNPLKAALQAAGFSIEVVDVGNSAPRSEAPGDAWIEWVDPDWNP